MKVTMDPEDLAELLGERIHRLNLLDLSRVAKSLLPNTEITIASGEEELVISSVAVLEEIFTADEVKAYGLYDLS